jgi:hypothetical protein
MKKLRQLCVAAMFTLVLTTATFGGDIATGGFTQPLPPPPASSSATSGSIETTSGGENPQDISDSVADLALNLLQTMLSVF